MSKQDESVFFNDAYSESSRSAVWKYYALLDGSREYYRQYLLANCSGRLVLEYGCGVGSYAFDLARHGAEVIGIDISDVAIEKAAGQAREKNLTKAAFVMMDAELMTFPECHFDLVCGTGILHHLRLEAALGELVRVLKPDGKAIFLEPLGHNPAINLFRALTPRLRTKDEHPLTVRDLAMIRSYFARTEIKYFALLSFLAVPFLKTRLFSPLLGLLERLDNLLFRLIPGMGRLAWYSAIVLSEPRKPDTVHGTAKARF